MLRRGSSPAERSVPALRLSFRAVFFVFIVLRLLIVATDEERAEEQSHVAAPSLMTDGGVPEPKSTNAASPFIFERSERVFRLTERVGPYTNASLPYSELKRALSAGVHRQRRVDAPWRALARTFAAGLPVRALVVGGSTMQGFYYNNSVVVFSEQYEQLLRRARPGGSVRVERHTYKGCGVDCYLPIYAQLAQNGSLAQKYDLLVLEHALNDRVFGERAMAHAAERFVRTMRQLAPTVALAVASVHAGVKSLAEEDARLVARDAARQPCVPGRTVPPHACEREHVPWLNSSAVLGDSYVLACYDVPRANMAEAFATFAPHSHGFALLADEVHRQPAYCKDKFHTGYSGHILMAQMLFELTLQQFEAAATSGEALAAMGGACGASPREPLLPGSEFDTADREVHGDELSKAGRARGRCWFWCGETAAESVPPMIEGDFRGVCRQRSSWRHNRTCEPADGEVLELQAHFGSVYGSGVAMMYEGLRLDVAALAVEYIRSYESFGDFSVRCFGRTTNISGSWSGHSWASRSVAHGSVLLDNADVEDGDVARGGADVASNRVSVRQRTFVWWGHMTKRVQCSVRALGGPAGNEVAIVALRVGRRVLRSDRKQYEAGAMLAGQQ